MAMRLDKFLSHMGYGTRNEVKNIIKNGWVTIEGKTIKKADHQVKEDQIVYVDDTPVSYIQYEYYILNKPKGYICSRFYDCRICVQFFVFPGIRAKSVRPPLRRASERGIMKAYTIYRNKTPARREPPCARQKPFPSASRPQHSCYPHSARTLWICSAPAF